MNEYMKIANDLAKQNDVKNIGGPFGAVVVRNGEIIGTGSNHVISYNDPTAHAEIVAIREACQKLQTFDLSNCELYTSCYPCPMCLSATIWSNIKTIYYGNTRTDAKDIGFRDDMIYEYLQSLLINKEDEATLKTVCIDREETIKVFRDFYSKPEKTMY